jgi:hypothetical protein
MRPDPDYIKRLLLAFQDAPDPTTDIEELNQTDWGILCRSWPSSKNVMHGRLDMRESNLPINPSIP